MSDSNHNGRFEFTSTTSLPSLEVFDQVKHLLVQLGTPQEVVLALHPTVVGFIADHLQQINAYKERIVDLGEEVQRLEFDVIRLRGQRNALRSALIKNHEKDPMLGYASDHMLEAITEVHIKKPSSRRNKSVSKRPATDEQDTEEFNS